MKKKYRERQQTLDLHSQRTKITNKLVIENTGKSPVCKFIFELDWMQGKTIIWFYFCFTARAWETRTQNKEVRKFNCTSLLTYIYEAFHVNSPSVAQNSAVFGS